MERQRPSGAADGERELRRRLEQLQVELREAKAQLERQSASRETAVQALEEAVAQARAREVEAQARATALKSELGRAHETLRRAEADARVLARGSRRRAAYSEWSTIDSPRHPLVVLVLALLVGASFVVLRACG